MAYERFAYFYDYLMRDMPYDSWIAFLRQCFAKFAEKPVQSIVDLGCGTGSIAIPLMELGYGVTGIDLSGDMLAVAKARADELQQQALQNGSSRLEAPYWLEQDMREWTAGQPVDCVISFCDSLNYITEESGIQQAFQQTAQGLGSGGLFVFDMLTIWQLENYAIHQPFYLDEEEAAYIWTSDWDEALKQIQHNITFFVHEERLNSIFQKRQDAPYSADTAETKAPRFIRVEETHVERAYPCDTVTGWLQAAGFDVIGVYSDFLWKPHTEQTERAFFVARKI